MATTEPLTSLLSNIDEISARVNTNALVQGSREAILTQMQDYSIDDDEKMKIYANHETTLTMGIMRDIIEMSKSMLLMDAETKKKSSEALLADAQRAKINAEKLLVDQQVLYSAAETSKKANESLLIAEQVLLTAADVAKKNAETGLVTEQVAIAVLQQTTEKLRQNDIKASITVKNQTALATYENARFEEARKEITLQANKDNMILKKADFKVGWGQVMATDDAYTLTETHLLDIKTSIDSIPVTGASYISNYSIVPTAIPTTVV